MLVYAAVAMILATGTADMNAAGLAFAFLAARLAHALEHTRRNSVPRRMMFFLASYAFAMLLWGWFGYRFLTGP
jgi:hypothetical protein